MNDLSRHLRTMKRPAMLIRAARHGVRDYNRQRDLRRLTRVAVPKTPEGALPLLLALEEKVEERRVTEDTNYSLPRHVDLLIAVIGEGMALGGPEPQPRKSNVTRLPIKRAAR